MKKPIVSYLMAALSMVFLSISCLKEEVPYLMLSTEEEVLMDSGGGSFTIEVKTNQSWTAVSDADWCVIEGGDGSYKGEFVIKVSANAGTSTRTANISIKGGTCAATVSVVQSCDDADFSLSVSEISFLNTADTYKLTVNSNYPWTAVSSSSWCILSESEGEGDAVIDVSAQANDTGEERKAAISFTVKTEGKSIVRTVNVVQSADSFWLELPLTEFTVSRGEGNLEIPYLVNGMGVAVECHSGADWISVVSVADGSAVVKVLENTTGAERSAEIAFNTSGQNGEPEVCRATVTQSGEASVLDVLVSEVYLLPSGEEIRLPFVANSPVEVRSSSDWCQASLDGDDIVVKADANTGEARTAYVTVSLEDQAGKTISKAIKVSQASDSFWLDLPLDDFTVSKDAGILEVSYLLKGEGVTVEVRSSADWITAGSAADGKVLLDIAENTSGEDRTAEISFNTAGQTGEPAICKAKVTQLGEASVLDVLVTEVSLISTGEEIRLPLITNGQVAVRSSSDWCSASVDGSDLVIGADMNTQEDRTAYVTVTVTEEDGDVLARSVKVFQKVAEMNFEFQNMTVTLSYDASTGYAQLISTGAWVLNNAEGSEIPAWLTVSPSSGEGDTMLTLTVQKNQFNRERRTQLSFTNTLMNKSIALEVIQEANPNGIENYKYLGMGYDVSGEYAVDSYVRSSVLDIDKLLAKGYVADVLNLNSTDERYIYGKTFEEYQQNLSMTAGVSGGLFGFSMSVTTSFSSRSLSSSENEFSSFRHITEKQSYKILANLTADDLKDCVIDYVQEDIDNMDVGSLFLKYGTHILTGFVLGGSLDYSMSADVSVMSSSVDWAQATNAGYSLLSMGVTASTGYSDYESMSKYAANFESSLKARGGESQYASQNPNVNESTYNEWLASLEDPAKWVMVDYDGSMLIPIWEFASTEQRKNEIAAAAASYLEKPEISVSTTHRTLSIKLLKVGYLEDDAGSEAELYGDMWYNLDATGEKDLGSFDDLVVPDKSGEYPSHWDDYGGNISMSAAKMSIYKDHTLFIRGNFTEDDVTGSEHYSGSFNLYYSATDMTWRAESPTGSIIGDGGTFILKAGETDKGVRCQFSFSWR